jgi:hypothetical protein
MSLGVKVCEQIPQRAHLAHSMLLDTTNSSDEEDALGVRLRTPPGASQAIPTSSVPQQLRRELLADTSCAQALIERLGEESEAFRIVTIDLTRYLDSGTASALASSTAIVMAPVLSNGLSASEAIEQLRGSIPHVGLYVVARQTGDVARALPKLAAAGIDEVFCLDVAGEINVLTDTLRARLSAPAPETEIRLLWKWFRESNERALVMHCVRNGYRLDVWTIRSKVFSACRKTLQNRMSLMGLPSPGILSRCGRVLHAQELERRGMKPTTAVAALLGFPSAGAMQRARRRLRKALMSRGRQALVFASLLK